jgi:hypothetical protein
MAGVLPALELNAGLWYPLSRTSHGWGAEDYHFGLIFAWIARCFHEDGRSTSLRSGVLRSMDLADPPKSFDLKMQNAPTL